MRTTILVAAVIAFIIGFGTSFEGASGALPPRRPYAFEEERFIPRNSPNAPFQLQSDYSSRCVTFFGTVVSGEVELSFRMTSPDYGVVLASRDSPAVQQAAAREFALALRQLRAESYFIRPELVALLPDEVTRADPADFGRAAFAAATVRGGTVGPWYGVALVVQGLALVVLLLCFTWMFFRIVITGYLDRTLARLTNGRCPDCRYDLRSGGLRVCPECGQDADATLAEAREIAEAINHRPVAWHAPFNEPPQA